MEDDTTRGIYSSLHPHIRRNSKNDYVDLELHRGTAKWKALQQNFIVTFSFEHENPNIDSSLKLIWGMILIDEPYV